jgi:peptidoglycan/LPS O-acetylase OafA/YrhL
LALDTTNRNFGLDLIRAISIWMVLLHHAGFNIEGLQPLTLGAVGVEVFFVLSGFLIGGILFREIDKGKSIFQTLKRFWTRRWLRILPLYYAILLIKFFFFRSIHWQKHSVLRIFSAKQLLRH